MWNKHLYTLVARLGPGFRALVPAFISQLQSFAYFQCSPGHMKTLGLRSLDYCQCASTNAEEAMENVPI